MRNVILCGDVREQLRLIPDETVNCVVTSPPYWGLRDYGTASWEGGDPEHAHRGRDERSSAPGSAKQASSQGANYVYAGNCSCGAVRVDSQIGLEATPEEYVCNMVEVFREVRRVLRKDGVLFLNLGDSYYGSNQTCGTNSLDGSPKRKGRMFSGSPSGVRRGDHDSLAYLDFTTPSRLKPKDLVGIPWRVAFALQADGWWLRSDIIWSKPNPMPESVTDRPTKAHEYVFLLSKSQTYYYDADAIREPYSPATIQRVNQPNFEKQTGGPKDYGPDSNRSARKSLENLKQNASGLRRYAGFNDRWDTSEDEGTIPEGGRNKRTVWEIATKPYPEAHFATYPEELVKPCILAGCPEGGIVLDPFLGSGTTAAVAKTAGRDWVGIELNPAYVELAKARINVDQERLL